jgi:hypothetical protein
MDVKKRLAEVAANKKLGEQYGVSDLRISGPVMVGGKQVTPGSTEYWEALQRFQAAPKTASIGTATGSYGGPGGAVNFTTAPGTVGSTLGGGGATGYGANAGGATGGVGGTNAAMGTAALQRLEAVGKGESGPVDAATKANMLSKQSDMSAAMESQQNAALRRTTAAGGGSLYDPSQGAAEGENAEERQLANMASKRDIDLGAQQQNWEAQFAANRLLAAQSDGGINSGNPYGQYGRYGAPPQQGQQTGAQPYQGPAQTPGTNYPDPQRGGNIQGYQGLQLNQASLTNTLTDQYASGQQAQANSQWNKIYQDAVNGGMPSQIAYRYANEQMGIKG